MILLHLTFTAETLKALRTAAPVCARRVTVQRAGTSRRTIRSPLGHLPRNLTSDDFPSRLRTSVPPLAAVTTERFSLLPLRPLLWSLERVRDEKEILRSLALVRESGLVDRLKNLKQELCFALLLL